MASKTDVWNSALQRLGSRRVETDTEQTAEAEALAAIWNETRLYVLAEHPWSFARTTQKLARLASPTPETVWKYFYQLPSDIVSILRVSDDTKNFEYRKGRSISFERQAQDRIATDAEDVYLYYITDVSDMNLWTPSVRSALAWRLAYEVAYRLYESSGKVDRAEAKYRQELQIAKSHDASRSELKSINQTSWITAREAAV